MAINPDDDQEQREEIAVHHELESVAKFTDDLISAMRRDRPRYSPRILIVEDDPHTAELEKHLLDSMGCLPLIMDTGRSAIGLIERGYKPDIIFLDLKLPDVNGSVVMRAVRRILPKVPVVVVTGFPDSQIMAEVMEMGPVMVVQKPLGLENVTRVLGDYRFSARFPRRLNWK